MITEGKQGTDYPHNNEGFMITIMPGISHGVREIEDTPTPGRVTGSAPGSVGCRRCGSLLVDEHCMDIGEEGNGYRFWGLRCVQCGDVIDKTILRNRVSPIETINKLKSRTRSRAIVQVLAGRMRGRREVCHSA